MTTGSTAPPQTASNALYHSVFDAMAEGVIVHCADGTVLAANPAARLILDLSASARPQDLRLITEDGAELSNLDIPAMVTLRTGVAISGFVMGVFRDHSSNPDTAPVWLSVNSRLLHDESGAVSGVFTTFSDISALKVAEAKLRESEARFRNILHTAPIGMAIVSLKGRFVQVNRAMCELIGYTSEELEGLTFRDITHSSDLEADHREILQLLRGEISSYHREHRYTSRRGGNVWISLTVSLLRDDQGTSLYFIVQLKNISERKADEERLNRLAQRLSLAVGCAQIGVWEWDYLSKIFYSDARISEIYGASQAAPPETLEEWVGYVLPEDRVRSRAVIQEIIETKQRKVFEYRIRRRDGAIRSMQVTADVMQDDGGNVTRVIGANLDITDSKSAEHVLRSARQQLRTLIDSLPALVFMIDSDQRCIIANQRCAEVGGRPLEEMEGHDYIGIIPEFMQERHRDMVARCFAGESVEFMEEHRNLEGVPMYLHGHYAPLYEAGKVDGIVLATMDVSELKRAQLQLSQLNTDLTAKVAEIHKLQILLQEMAVRDALTGLHNRRFLDEQLPRELARARRLKQPLCVALGDIDHFKKLNDTYGHQAGDAVLRTLRNFFATLVRETDIVCRWGGEEILIVMPDLAPDMALQCLERLREALSHEIVEFGPHRLQVTISFGIASYVDGASIDEIIHAADTALYAAKAAGRNNCQLFSALVDHDDVTLAPEPSE